MAETEKMSVPQYAEHRGISRQRVYTYVNQGKLSKSVVMVDGKTRIDRDMADHELAETLDRIYNRPDSRAPAPPTDGLALQDKAVDIASEGEPPGPGYITPWPLWACRYIGALADLAPDRIEIIPGTGSEWMIVVHDLHTETAEHIPWSVSLCFDFKIE